MLFLHANGVGTSRAVRIFKTNGAKAVAFIFENPYRLARDIRGIGFKTADQIAMKLGIGRNAMIRVRASVSYALSEAMDDGHCGLPENEPLRDGVELLEVASDRLTAALGLELQVSISVEKLPGNSVQKFPLPQLVFGCFLRCLKRKESLPVSRMSQWWVTRSSSAVVIFGSPKTPTHSAKERLVVKISDVFS